MDAYEKIKVIGRGELATRSSHNHLADPPKWEGSELTVTPFAVLPLLPAGSYGSALLVRARAAPTREEHESDGAGASLPSPATHPQRLYVIKQINLTALQEDGLGAERASSHADAASVAAHDSVAHSSADGAPSHLSTSLLNEVQILMRVGDGHPNVCRYRGRFPSFPLRRAPIRRALPRPARVVPREPKRLRRAWA